MTRTVSFGQATRQRLAREKYPKSVGVGTWLTPYTFRDEAGQWLTIKGASQKTYRLPRKSLERWSVGDQGAGGQPCRFLIDDMGPRTIRHQHVPTAYPRNEKEVLVLWKVDLDAIQRARRPKQERIVHRDEQGTWLTEAQICARYPVSRIFTQYWSKHESKIRPGEKALRSKAIVNAVKQRGSPGEILAYLEADVVAILAKRESDIAATGQGRAARKAQRDNATKAERALRDILRAGPLPSTEVFARAHKAGVAKHLIYRAKQVLKVRSKEHGTGPWWWFLPGQKLPELKTMLARQAELIARIQVQESTGTEQHEVQLTKKKLGGGRPTSKATARVYAFCYERYMRGDKLPLIRREAAREFGNLAPKEDSHVRLYAKRHATKHHKVWVPRS
jgi:hypothetical protein